MNDPKKKKNSYGMISYKYYKLFAETSKDCFWIFNYTNQRFKYISPSVYELFGLSIDDVMNARLEHSFSRISMLKIREKIIPKTVSEISEIDGYKCNIEDIELYCKDGTVKTIEISARLVFNKKTNSVEIIGVTRDITIQKQYENELHNKLKYFPDTNEKGKDYMANATQELKFYFFNKFTVYG